MGVNNALYFPIIKQNFGVDYQAEIDQVACFKDTIGYFGTSSDMLVAYAKSLIDNPEAFKDKENIHNATVGLVDEMTNLIKVVGLRETATDRVKNVKSPLAINPLQIHQSLVQFYIHESKDAQEKLRSRANLWREIFTAIGLPITEGDKPQLEKSLIQAKNLQKKLLEASQF